VDAFCVQLYSQDPLAPIMIETVGDFDKGMESPRTLQKANGGIEEAERKCVPVFCIVREDRRLSAAKYLYSSTSPGIPRNSL
jgi:hypothetical protein